MKKYSRTVPAWKRKYDEAYIAAGNKIPDGMSARAYNQEFGEQNGIPYGTVNSHHAQLQRERPPEEKTLIPNEWKYQIQKDLANGNIPLVAQPYIKRIATTYDVSPGTVNSFYYKELNELKEKEQPTTEAQETPKEEVKEVKKRGPKPKHLEWQEQIVSDIESNNLPSMASVYFQQVALAFGINDKTVKAYYYKYLALHKEKTAKSLVEPATETPEQPKPEEPKKPPLHPGYLYRKGSVVKVRVKHIESGYVLVDTLDEYRLTGMIHISNISNTFIADINKWFRFGMELNAQVLDYTELDGGRLNLSTRNLPFTAMSWKYQKQPKNESMQEQLTEVASKLFKTDIKTDNPAVATTSNQKEGDEKDMELEWKQAKPFLESIIGTISAAAEVEMRKIMKESGVFAFTVALMGKKDNFTPDIGLMLAQAIRKDLNIPAEQVLPR